MLKSGEKLRKLLMLLATWGLLLACFIAYERYFVMGQRDFLKEDGFRALTTLSGELNAQIQKAQKSTEASIKLANLDPKQDLQKQENTLRNFLRLYVTDAPISLQDIKSCSQRSRENAASPPTKISPVRNTLALSVSCYDSDRALYTVDLVKGVGEVFEKQSGHFDDVLVADESGNVIYQKSVTGADPSLSKSGTKPQITNLSSLLTSSTTVEPKKSPEKKNTSDKGSDAKTTDSGEKSKENSVSDDDRFYRLLGASAFAEVTAAGKTYEMFSRPVPIQLPGGKSWNLVVIGLWDAQQFDQSSRRIPYSALIWAGLIAAALLSLSWPLFKLRFMSKTERFTPADGWYLVLALFLASTSVMLMLLNATYNAHERNKSDEDLQKLAQLIKSNLKDEIETAVSQLDRLSVPLKILQGDSPDLQGDFLTQQDLLKGSSSFPNSSADFPYLYLDSAFWVKGSGWQHYKVDVRSTPTPIINVANRPYFKRAVSGNAQHIDTHYLQPILTRSTDEFEVDVAGLYLHHHQEEVLRRDKKGSPLKNEEQIQVEVLSFRPMSLVNPVLPPGYRFAVIDSNCNVLFHSESYRNMREDFCEDSLDKNELRPWLFSGVDTPLDISYEGNTQRAYLSTLESPRFALEGSNAESNTTQVFLLVFRKPEIALTLNLAIVLVCAVLMGSYFVVVLLIAAAYLLARKAWQWVYMPRFLFPQRRNTIAYLQIFFANVLILLLFWQFYPQLYEAPLLGLTVVVAVVSILFSISKLALPNRGPLAVGAVLATVLLISLVAIPSRAANDPRDWEYVWVVLSAACLIAISLADRISAAFIQKALSKIGLSSDLIKNHFSKAYILAVLSVITAAGLVPCIGFFKYSYDAITELALKRDEIEISERLIRREAVIREYYNGAISAEGHGVKLPVGAEEPIVKRRIGEHWDRYDSSPILPKAGTRSFEVGEASTPNPCESDDLPSGQKKLSRDDLNEVIERVVANATLALTLPTNSLGSQMSKLGVASTADTKHNWEHCWIEPAPTSFQLVWKSTSRWPNQTVTATYSDWKGLRRWPRIFLVLLWVGLGCWLAIVLKEVLLTDLEDATPFEDVNWNKVADIQQHYLVIAQAESGRKLWKQITDLPPTNRLDLRIELKKTIEDKTYWPIWEKSVRVLILDHFDFNLRDEDYNRVRLGLLETLLCESDLKLVIISTIDPLYSLTDDATDTLADGKDSATRRLLGRWAAALSKFRKVHLADLSQAGFERALQEHSNDPVFAARVKQECDHTSKLREIGETVLNEHSGDNTPSREWVVSRVMGLADSYYHALWTRLSSTERLVLYQLARDGWSNPKNLAAIQQLEAKQLVRRDPMYKIINESFRRFVLSPEHADDIAQWVKLEQQSTWHALKFVVIAIGIGFAAWLLYTQAALSQQVVGYIAAIATLLTAAGSLFGRSGKSTSAKAEGE
jgi:hypothetical protein